MTGLSQSLIDKPVYYYNLKDHYSFFFKNKVSKDIKECPEIIL